MGLWRPPPAHAGSSAEGLTGPTSAAKSKAADKAGQPPLSLRFAVLDHLAGQDPELPAGLLLRYRGETVLATYLVCIRADGTVLSAHRRSGIADADAEISSALRTWRYPPQPPNTLTCVHEVFEFSP